MSIALMLQDELSSTQKSLAEAQEALRLSKEEAASIGKEAASAEAASEELVERLNTDNARLEASIGILHASVLAPAHFHIHYRAIELHSGPSRSHDCTSAPMRGNPRTLQWWQVLSCWQASSSTIDNGGKAGAGGGDAAAEGTQRAGGPR